MSSKPTKLTKPSVSINNKFGHWIVIEKTKSKSTFKCLCTKCNSTIRLIRKWNLLKQQSKSCGCGRVESMKATNLKKYGTEFVQQNKQVHDKQQQTMLSLYNVKSYSQTKDYHIKRKQTCLNKYQAEHHSKSEKWKNRNKPKYGGMVFGKVILGS